MRARPQRLARLPRQYFVELLGRVAEAAAEDGPPLVDLGRGNPDVGPPAHVVEALRYARGLQEANRGSEVHVALPDATAWVQVAALPRARRTPVSVSWNSASSTS